MVDVDFKKICTSNHKKSYIGNYILNKIKKDGCFNIELTNELRRFFNSSSDGSTFRESFISVIVSIIGDYEVLNNFVKTYGGEYQIVSDIDKVPLYSSNFCIYSGNGYTHYNSHSKNGVYEPYDNHQIPYTNGFCQVFSVYNNIEDVLSNYYGNMKQYDYANNALKALKFVDFILKQPHLTEFLNNSIREIYKESKKYDLKIKPKLTIKSIRKIINKFNKIDIYPLILSAADDICLHDKIVKNFISRDKLY